MVRIFLEDVPAARRCLDHPRSRECSPVSNLRPDHVLTHGNGDAKRGWGDTLTFKCTPENRGFIAASVNIGFGVTLKDGSYSTKNTTKVYLPSGTQEDVILTIKVPIDKLREYTDAKGTLDVYTSIRTLNDLVRLDYNSKIKGGS
jgi:hypothetical protein